MIPQSIFEVVRLYGGMIGVSDLAPHDLRRTFAKLYILRNTGVTSIFWTRNTPSSTSALRISTESKA